MHWNYDYMTIFTCFSHFLWSTLYWNYCEGKHHCTVTSTFNR